MGRGPGFASADNRRYLRQGDHYYIIGERLRSGSAEAALSRQGRYQDVADNLEVNEVRIGEADQFVICFNTHGAMRHAAIRERLLAQLQELIAGTDTPTATKRAELRGVISTKPGLNCYLRTTPKGLLRIDAAKVKAETNLDGKYLLCCSDPKLPAEDIALGYKQLLEVEQGWPDMKQVIDLRPVYHQHHVEAHPHRVRPAHSRHLHRPDRHLPPARRADQAPARHPGQTRHSDTEEDRRGHPRRRRLTRHTTPA
ncbi:MULTISPECIES: hypothetical protein [Nonomuraea]|uniref:Uncharacterized protein n=1 Tax=Nonomuraea ferruginea TaxID=46174 RepID=A0ABT4T0R9_9ACTN|nr:hypothetical protein [Nonomuraea ferruginea]MDA0643112.1 hypothetical protein [Nonomuraea ferruginea]